MKLPFLSILSIFFLVLFLVETVAVVSISDNYNRCSSTRDEAMAGWKKAIDGIEFANSVAAKWEKLYREKP